MEAPWYYLLIYVVIGSLILWFFDKKQIIKSKRLRYFIELSSTHSYAGAYMTLLLAGNGRMAIRALGNGTYRKRRIRGHKGHAGKFSG